MAEEFATLLSKGRDEAQNLRLYMDLGRNAEEEEQRRSSRFSSSSRATAELFGYVPPAPLAPNPASRDHAPGSTRRQQVHETTLTRCLTRYTMRPGPAASSDTPDKGDISEVDSDPTSSSSEDLPGPPAVSSLSFLCFKVDLSALDSADRSPPARASTSGSLMLGKPADGRQGEQSARHSRPPARRCTMGSPACSLTPGLGPDPSSSSHRTSQPGHGGSRPPRPPPSQTPPSPMPTPHPTPPRPSRAACGLPPAPLLPLLHPAASPHCSRPSTADLTWCSSRGGSMRVSESGSDGQLEAVSCRPAHQVLHGAAAALAQHAPAHTPPRPPQPPSSRVSSPGLPPALHPAQPAGGPGAPVRRRAADQEQPCRPISLRCSRRESWASGGPPLR